MRIKLIALLFILPFVPVTAGREAGLSFCAVRPAVIYRIARREGFGVARTLPTRLHNPGSLTFHDQPGAVRGKLGFAQFLNDEAGWSALDRDVRAKVRRGIPLRIAWTYLKD